MLTLAALSLNRMLAFIPLCNFDGKITSFAAAAKIVCLIWLYALALSLPPVFGWGRYLPEISGLG